MFKCKPSMGNAWTALVIAAVANFALADEAHADGRLCNDAGTGIWVGLTKPDVNCNGNLWRQISWYHIPAGGPCIQMFSESAANKTYYYFAMLDDGTPLTGSSFVWSENWNNGSSPPVSACFDNAQLLCTNPGANCAAVGHTRLINGNFTRWTLTIDP